MYNNPNQITYVPDKFKVPKGLRRMTIRMQTEPGQFLPNEIKELEAHQQMIEELGAIDNPKGF